MLYVSNGSPPRESVTRRWFHGISCSTSKLKLEMEHCGWAISGMCLAPWEMECSLLGDFYGPPLLPPRPSSAFTHHSTLFRVTSLNTGLADMLLPTHKHLLLELKWTGEFSVLLKFLMKSVVRWRYRLLHKPENRAAGSNRWMLDASTSNCGSRSPKESTQFISFDPALSSGRNNMADSRQFDPSQSHLTVRRKIKKTRWPSGSCSFWKFARAIEIIEQARFASSLIFFKIGIDSACVFMEQTALGMNNEEEFFFIAELWFPSLNC